MDNQILVPLGISRDKAMQELLRQRNELEENLKISIEALEKIMPNNPGDVNFGIAQDALDKIKGRF